MTALQHLDVLLVAKLSADEICLTGQLRHLTTLKLPALEEVRACAAPPNSSPALMLSCC
jgi:hypothetical protein